MRPRSLCLSLLSLAALASCYSSADKFSAKVAKYECTWLEECAKSQFEDQYDGDRAKCRDEVQDGIEELIDAAEALGCEYDPDGGKECGNALRKSQKECSSDEFEDNLDGACDEYLDCPGVERSETIDLQRRIWHGARVSQ